MKKLLHIWLLCAILIGWLWLISKGMTLSFSTQKLIIAFAIAPIGEEILYRWLPVHLENSFPQLRWFPGVFANFLFIGIHVNNYPFAGWYWAFAVQGTMGFICLYVCRKYGVWASMLIHCKYNLAVHFINF